MSKIQRQMEAEARASRAKAEAAERAIEVARDEPLFTGEIGTIEIVSTHCAHGRLIGTPCFACILTTPPAPKPAPVADEYGQYNLDFDI